MSNSESATALGNGAFRIERRDGRHATAFALTDGPTAWVFYAGHTYVIGPEQTRRVAVSQDPAALAAPMPATVTAVHVSPGQRVRAGDVLVTLEAMKMELPIRAATDGVVASVNCRVGEIVQPDTPLIALK